MPEDPDTEAVPSANPELRPYDPDAPDDRQAVWSLKRCFETGLGAGTGDGDKRETYESKLTDDYRASWLSWVERCVADDERCVTLATAGSADGADIPESSDGGDGDDSADETAVVGYVFVLPERLAYIWDAAVVNEIYVVAEYRGTGVADALLDAAVDIASEQSLPLDRLLLDVDPDNERAYAFYERHGFEPWGEIVARQL